MRVFLAGATGAIGRPLVALLREAGVHVTGTTRSPGRAAELRTLGAEPVVVDMTDAESALRAVTAAKPDVVIHQLTDLPSVLDPAGLSAALARNARLRTVATPILMRAARAAGARRAIVQSICFVYADGPQPHLESDRLDPSPERKVTVDGVRALEESALGTSGVASIVLRYGRLWGPGTWTAAPKGPAPLHVDAAAHAALLALTRGTPGLYNIAEDDGTVSIAKAQRELGFDPAFRLAR